MRVLTTADLQTHIQDKYIYFDNDFLGELFEDKRTFALVIRAISFNPIIIDPLTKFEFLRSVFLPAQLEPKREFIESVMFAPAPMHPLIWLKLQVNALLLSNIYAHQNSAKGCSFVDLFLSARIMAQHVNYVLITGDRKGFPDCVFDVLSVINIQQKDEKFKPYYLVVFNKSKFDKCLADLKLLEKMYKIEIE